MKKKNIIPKALFDKLSLLDELPFPCISEYLTKLKINNINKEYKMALLFLKSYSGSQDTFTAYRREIEKLLQWSWVIRQKPIKELKREDIIDYLEFIQDPPQSWITTKTVSRFISDHNDTRKHNKAWRPFVVKIAKHQYKEGKIPYKHNFRFSKKSIQATFASLSTFYTFLTQEQYLKINPVALIRQKSRFIQREQTTKVTRKLSNLQWKTVIKGLETLIERDPSYIRHYFIIASFFLLGVRISELAETPGRIPKMGDFYPDKSGLWWFTTVGKGNKARDVAVPDELLTILKQYRVSRDLSPLPSRQEQEPLVHKTRGKDGLGTRQIRNLVQFAFDHAVEKLQQKGNTDEAYDLQTATVHWLRHTAISRDVIYRPREHIRDDVGHENPATMDKYIDTDRDARHKSAKDKTLK